MKRMGSIHLYTGEGKGKTTAAVGLACRARGHNLKVCYIYFHKEPDRFGCGELKSLKRLGVDIFGFAMKHPHFCKKIDRGEIRKECLKAIEFIRNIFQMSKYDVLILDEILISLRDGFLKEKEILDILNSKPEDLEIILTGRGAGQKIIKKADLVSRIEKIKHPFDCGIKGRKGIEY